METSKEVEMEGRKDSGVCLLLNPSSPSCPSHLVGGKGHNLWELGRMERCHVPPWFCITTDAFTTFIEVVHVIIIATTSQNGPILRECCYVRLTCSIHPGHKIKAVSNPSTVHSYYTYICVRAVFSRFSA